MSITTRQEPLDLWVPITDNNGDPFDSTVLDPEPEPGSILLTEGVHGTAWQKFFSDGLWHRAGGNSTATWEALITKRNVVLVYDAARRDERRGV